MRVLLPPSEAKTPGGRGRPLSSRPDDELLGPARNRALDALAVLVGGDRGDAGRALLLPPAAVAAALAANARVRTSATTPALRRYAGVLYAGLGFHRLSALEQRVAARSVLIFSGLLGVVRGDEPVPDYRVPAKAALPRIGTTGTFWKPTLREAGPRLLGGGLIVDLRSADYSAMWRPHSALAPRIVSVRVLSPGPRGPAVISFPSKYAKGVLTAALVRRLAAGGRVENIHDVAAAWLDAGGVGTRVVDENRLDILTATAAAPPVQQAR